MSEASALADKIAKCSQIAPNRYTVILERSERDAIIAALAATPPTIDVHELSTEDYEAFLDAMGRKPPTPALVELMRDFRENQKAAAPPIPGWEPRDFSNVEIDKNFWFEWPKHEPTGWQSISTAPSDGRDVLVNDVWPVRRVRCTQADGDWWRRGKLEAVKTIPTHWMPLPPAPPEPSEVVG